MKLLESKGFVIMMFIACAFCIVMLLYSRYHLVDSVAQEHHMRVQNEAALQAQLTQKADSLQNLATLVQDLNKQRTTSQKKAGYWQLTASTLQTQLDSVQASGGAVASAEAIVDSLGTYYRVTFRGKQGITSYDGSTRYYIAPTLRSDYVLYLSFDPINTSSEFYRDTDQLWKIKTTSLTPGVKLETTSIVDSTLFSQASGGSSKAAEQTVPSFGFRLKGNLALLGKSSSSNTATIGFDGSIEAYYKYLNATWYPATNTFSAGVVVDLNVGKWLSRIF